MTTIAELCKEYREKMDSLFSTVVKSIKAVCPKDKIDTFVNEILEYQDWYDAAVKANTEVVLNQFCLHILPHAPQIYNRDERYFIDDENEKTEVDSGKTVDLKMLKHLWQYLDNNNEKHLKIKTIIINKAISITQTSENYFNLKYGDQ